jgi:hypothetical protein
MESSLSTSIEKHGESLLAVARIAPLRSRRMLSRLNQSGIATVLIIALIFFVEELMTCGIIKREWLSGWLTEQCRTRQSSMQLYAK